MLIRNATQADWQDIVSIYSRARQYMRDTGNPNQWKNTSPTDEQLQKDIANGSLYIALEDCTIHGVFAMIPGPDPTYAKIDGCWLNETPYMAIHRVASAGIRKGMLTEFLSFALQHHSNLRIDTHQDNRIMQHLLEKKGFIRCGIIYLANGDPRIAYQYIKEGC